MNTQTIDNTKAVAKKDRKLKRPKKYNLVFHNDDYTPFEFVEELLMKVFRRTADEAAVIASSVDNTGTGVAGTYTKEISEMKLHESNNTISKTEYPLLVTMEPSI